MLLDNSSFHSTGMCFEQYVVYRFKNIVVDMYFLCIGLNLSKLSYNIACAIFSVDSI